MESSSLGTSRNDSEFGAPQKGSEIVKVTTNIYTARGYGPSNTSMIIGTGGIILIDSGADPSSARTILSLFRSISDLPFQALIFTHGHGDHTGGAAVYLEENPQLEIWAASNFNCESNEFLAEGIAPLMAQRGARQLGLSASSTGNAFDARKQVVTPTHSIDTAHRCIELCGIHIEFFQTPSETKDHMAVWLPNDMVLFCGDTFYPSFPNAYPIRGGQYRDLATWAHSLDLLVSLPINRLIPGHGDVLEGIASIHEILCTYRDAMRYVLEKTIEGMNQGLDPDELVACVRLPEIWVHLPYLQENYGNIAWTVRAIYHAKAGWFNGNPSTLNPLHPREEAQRMVRMVGKDELLDNARAALEAGDYQWAAQLADYLLALNAQDKKARLLKASALEKIAATLNTQTGRRYCLSTVVELRADK